MTSKILLTYLLYLPVALGLTLYVARTLFANGRVFMLDIFKGKEDIAHATNKLFEVGFYLLNMGYALLIMKVTGYYDQDPLDTNQELVETLANKLGGFAIYLGVMLFLNLFLFFRGRKKSRMGMMPPAIPVISTPAL
jgi:predicted PurR-regulated permease PerM